jgi:hypothetical protein
MARTTFVVYHVTHPTAWVNIDLVCIPNPYDVAEILALGVQYRPCDTPPKPPNIICRLPIPSTRPFPRSLYITHVLDTYYMDTSGKYRQWAKSILRSNFFQENFLFGLKALNATTKSDAVGGTRHPSLHCRYMKI